jgi:DNA mismatch endonuclease (patch repair protein)
MSRIRSKNTKAELTLRRALFGHGLRYRLHVAGLPGKPDIVLAQHKVAVFMDGDFWHGWRFEEWAYKLAPFWRAKIERNRARDAARTRELRDLGWRVVRIWEHQVNANPEACARRILRVIESAGAASTGRNGRAQDRTTSRRSVQNTR